MKSFVMSMYLLTSAFGSALGIALSPTAVDPQLVWMYTGLCVATIIVAALFWIMFRKYNATEEEMNALENRGEKAVAAHEVNSGGNVEPLDQSTTQDSIDGSARPSRTSYTEERV